MLHENQNSRGVAILLKRNFEYKVHPSYNDQSGNLIILNLEISNTSIKLINSQQMVIRAIRDLW